MKPKLKKILILIGGAAALLIVTAVILLFLVDVDIYKPWAEAAVSEALGLDFRINGKMSMAIFPGFGLSARDVTIGNRGKDFVWAEKLSIGLKLIPLLRQEMQINKFEVVKPKLILERDKNGKFNFERQKPKKDEGFPAELLTVEKVTVSNGEISYTDKLSGLSRELRDFDLTINGLSLKGQKKSGFLKSISFQGELKGKEVRTKDLELKDIKFEMKGSDGIFHIDPLSVNLFGGKGNGSMEIDMTQDEPIIRIQFAASKFLFEKFSESISRKKIAKGVMDFSTTITAKGKNLDEMKKHINGDVTLRGENLLLYSFDIDNLLTKIEKSQSFSLIDIGTFFLVGPLGIVATKGYDYAALYRATGGSEGDISKLVSKWKIRNSVTEAADVALTTKKNRLALQGRLDFVNKRYDKVVVGVVDAKGCLKLSQKIDGPFSKPKVEKMGTTEALAGPVLKLFKQAKKLLTGGECKPFYEGSLKHPD